MDTGSPAMPGSKGQATSPLPPGPVRQNVRNSQAPPCYYGLGCKIYDCGPQQPPEPPFLAVPGRHRAPQGKIGRTFVWPEPSCLSEHHSNTCSGFQSLGRVCERTSPVDSEGQRRTPCDLSRSPGPGTVPGKQEVFNKCKMHVRRVGECELPIEGPRTVGAAFTRHPDALM